MSCLKLDERTSLLIGCLSPTTALIRFEEGAIRATSLDCNPDLELNWFLAIGTENECLSAYTHELRTLFPQHNLPEEYFGAVWSSWYSWFEEITAEHIQQEIKPAAELGYTILQIDDGWERAVGDWEANQDFPGGMSEIASEISDQDLIPGLWIAPFIAMEDTPLVAQHPEYFVHDDDGALKPAGYNWGQYYYGLDCTHPGAQEWLRQLLRKVRSWGYSYFKLDFLNAAAIEGTRLDNIDREMAYRTGLDIVREELDDCYIMASGAVIAPSLGLVDGMRIGPDTAPYWDNTDRFRDPTGPAVRNALRNVMARYWLHGVAHIDPDVVFARTHGSLLSPEVNHITHDLARVCGVLGCSDPAQWLTDEQRTEIRSLCEEFSQTNNRPEIEHLSRYVFTIAGRNVDFEPWIYPDGRISDRILVK
nr:glycoside hydrolase family 36 protein [Arcanobacterium pluranimalium]